jgi:hypothetical protein
MSKPRRIGGVALLLSTAVLAPVSTGWSASYSGVVMTVDESAGRIVVGDMGPLLPSGKSDVIRRTIQVTPSTEFAKVKRASGAGPRGWIGEYVETKLPAWGVKSGDFVTVEVKPDGQGAAALKVTLVDTSEP